MKRVILTGGTGFIGANLARKLLNQGHEIHLLVRPQYNPWRIDSIRHNIRLWEADFQDAQQLKAIVAEIRPEWVFHLAAYGAYPFQTDLNAMIQTNFIGTVNLVQACLSVGFEAFINAGASSEYGFKDHAPEENEWLEPNSHYAITKASATIFCRYTAQSKGVNLCTLRLYSTYGPFEQPSRLIPALLISGMQKKLPPMANPGISRDFVFIDDVCRAFLLTASNSGSEPGLVYNVGTGIQVSLYEVVEIARRLLDIQEVPVWGSMHNREWDTTTWVSNPQLINHQIGWSWNYSFEQGLQKTIDWFYQHPEMIRIYQGRNR